MHPLENLVIRTQGLSKTYQGVNALQPLDLHVARHSIFGFLGPNGEAVLRGPLADQAALHGVLIKIRDLGLPLVAVTLVATDETDNNHS